MSQIQGKTEHHFYIQGDNNIRREVIKNEMEPHASILINSSGQNPRISYYQLTGDFYSRAI